MKNKDKLPGLLGRFKLGHELQEMFQIEKRISWMVLRAFLPGNFTQRFANLKHLDTIQFADICTSMPSVDPRYVDRVATNVSLNRMEHHAYETSGPEEKSIDDIARKFGAVLHRTITFKTFEEC